jgi:vacuolar-type H+-ATPase subunit F/Vma7
MAISPRETSGDPHRTRMVFLGQSALAEGFALIGFETRSNATVAELDDLLAKLLAERQHAFLVIEQDLARAESRLLPLVYAEGGRIVVAEVPPLAHPEAVHIDIDDQIQTLLGGQSLDE